MKLSYGKRYKAKIELGFFEKNFVSNKMIVNKLEEAGFIGVQVTGDGGTRYAVGTWAGVSMEYDEDSIDEHIVDVSEVQ